MKKQCIVVLAFAVLAATACKKHTGEPAGDALLTLVPDNQYMPSDKIDSAIVTWQTGTQVQTVTLELKDQQLVTGIKNLQEGTGTLTVQVFSRVMFANQYASVWIQEKQLTIRHTDAVKLAAPNAFTDAQWYPRAQLGDAVGHFAVVALRPDDPYFFVRNVPASVLGLIVARDYYNFKGGVTRVGGGEWSCRQNCTDANHDVKNITFFKGLPQLVGNKSWNHLEIAVLYTTDPAGGGYILSLNHTF